MIALVCLAILGCTREPKIIYKKPVCAPVPFPILPIIKASALADLPPDVYWKLETRERLITDWALENEAIINKLCETP